MDAKLTLNFDIAKIEKPSLLPKHGESVFKCLQNIFISRLQLKVLSLSMISQSLTG